jgi:hypothetical protein
MSRVLEKLGNSLQQFKMGRMKQRRLDPKLTRLDRNPPNGIATTRQAEA